MQAISMNIPEVLVFEPRVFGDDRGFFMESYNQRSFDHYIGSTTSFVQDNHSGSVRNVLRGLHYQVLQPQGKLVRAISGEIFDVAVDIRQSSSTFGQWVGINLSGENRKQMWIPSGFAHGFLVLSEFAEVLYKTTDFYSPEHERCIRWNDPDLRIAWPLKGRPSLSQKDSQGLSLHQAQVFD